MAAPKGNQFWKLADKPMGAPMAFESAQELWDKAKDYFDWCDKNPLQEEKLFHYQGIITRDTVAKMRAYTLRDLCLHLGVNTRYLEQFNEEGKEDFSTIIARIRDIIYTQKFTGAAADLLNPNIIARELGLSDKQLHGNDPDNPLPSSTPLILTDGRTYEDLKNELKPE